MNEPKRHPLVESDIEQAARYYEDNKPGLGSEFIQEMQRIIHTISNQPLRFSVRFGNWRRANLRRFPYAIFYQVSANRPVIFAVLYGGSDFKPVLEGREP